MTTEIDWDDIRRRHGNCLKSAGAGDWPVVSWDEFEPVALDMVAAEAEYDRAMREALDHLDRLVPPGERHCGWYLYAPAPVSAIYDLFTDAPNSLHPCDFRFHLTYGKAKRAPLAHMRRVAEKYRIHARKVRRVMDKHLAAAYAAINLEGTRT